MLHVGPLLAVLVAIVTHQLGLPVPAAICAGTAALCALWWISECVPMGVVGLVPLVIFPVTGILGEKEVAGFYWNDMIMLLMGGSFLSAAMENAGAHRRLALTMVRAVGRGGPRTFVAGMMLTTALLSMWISNTATTLMMVPIALAVLGPAPSPPLRAALLLGIAYSSSLGGMATPIGTPPNVIFKAQMEQLYGVSYSFPDWMRVGVPIVLVLLPIVWWLLTRRLESDLRIEVPEPGAWRTAEVRVLAILTLTALAWTFRENPAGGWTGLLPTLASEGKSMIRDTTIAVAAALAVFLCPAGDAEEPEKRLLSWSDAATKVPWGILIMFGGGLALAGGFVESGLSAAIAEQLVFLGAVPPWLILLILCGVITMLTEITSGTATASLMLPILAGLAEATGMPPATVMIAGTISCSCAFMLPVATAPNAIVYAAGIKTSEMARAGLALNFAAATVIAVLSYWLVR